jgi:hypothetical protein
LILRSDWKAPVSFPGKKYACRMGNLEVHMSATYSRESKRRE